MGPQAARVIHSLWISLYVSFMSNLRRSFYRSPTGPNQKEAHTMSTHPTVVESIDTATLAAELKRRELAEAQAAHRAAFPPPGGPRHFPDRSTLRDLYVAKRQAARQLEERARVIAYGRAALTDVRPFEEATAHLTGDAAESAGRSGADDIANLTAIDLAALDYEAGSNDKLAAARRVNESRLHGETGPDGNWTPTYHTERRQDGTKFRRYVSEQVHHVSEVHQIDGGETIIVAVKVAEFQAAPHVDDCPNTSGQMVPVFHVMRCSKRRLDLRIIPQRNLWAKLHPNRNIPMKRPAQFIYEPEAYVTVHTDADAAADLAWRWANELKLDRDFTIEVEPMPEISTAFMRSEALAKHRAEARARGAAYPI